MKRLFAMLSLPLAAFASAAAAAPPADAWDIGPVIRGQNYSVGMPATLLDSRSGPFFEFPGPTERAGHVHYVTLPVRSLDGARSLTIRFRIDAERGARFVARDLPGEAATLSMYFQRAGDNWTSRGAYEDYRWYAPASTLIELSPGVYERTIRLDGNWTNVNGKRAADKPRGFDDAMAEASRVGFTFGSSSRRGHGVYATQPARFTLLDFRID